MNNFKVTLETLFGIDSYDNEVVTFSPEWLPTEHKIPAKEFRDFFVMGILGEGKLYEDAQKDNLSVSERLELAYSLHCAFKLRMAGFQDFESGRLYIAIPTDRTMQSDWNACEKIMKELYGQVLFDVGKGEMHHKDDDGCWIEGEDENDSENNYLLIPMVDIDTDALTH